MTSVVSHETAHNPPVNSCNERDLTEVRKHTYVVGLPTDSVLVAQTLARPEHEQ